jgi:23S rRNA (adenine2503-C2)-methyltransferase
MYRDTLWLRHIDEAPASFVQNGFGDAFRRKFYDIATMDGGLHLQEEYLASDGTRKLVFRVHSGPAAGGKIETVLIPIVREQGKKDRITLCVSSQVGCAMGCKFCYTGKMGLLGNLTPAQIVEQVVSARRFQFEQTCLDSLQLDGHDSLLKAKNKFTTTINNIVFMGMGEPLHNLPGILPAIDILLDHHGLHFSHNKVTVSTVGLIPEMKTLLKSCRASLAVSLHGATDAVRGSIVPVNLRYPVEELVSVLREEFPIEANGGSHVLIEYTMMDQVNDSIEDAKALLSLLKGVKCKINLIVFNPHEGTEYRASTPEAVDAFRDILIKGGRVATVRCSRGEDSMAACGQLGEGKRAVPL